MQEEKGMDLRISDSKGFTLLEVLVALVIFSFGFVVLTGLLSLGLRSIRKSEDASASVWIARDQIERMLINPDLSPGEARGVTNEGYRWINVVEEIDLFEEGDEKSIKAYKIKAIVMHPNQSEESSYQLETLKVFNPNEIDAES